MMAVFDGGAVSPSSSTGNTINYLGAAASFVVMIGIGAWSYDLIKRDVSGIPVVRAIEGDMRVPPENPGGEIASHTGLSVNEVSAQGEAAGLSDTLVLAPATADLAQEDLDLNPSAEEGEVAPLEVVETVAVPVVADPTDPTEQAVVEAMTTEELLEMADLIATGVEPLEALNLDSVVPPVLALDGETQPKIIAASVPGVATSLRPVVRPAGSVAQVVAAVASAEAPAIPQVNTEVPIPAGTHLVQLGAYPSTGAAATAWASLQETFGDFLVNKERVIQTADSGEGTFYRLRAMGFDDLSDARRFCAAMEAGNVDCIPVVVR